MLLDELVIAELLLCKIDLGLIWCGVGLIRFGWGFMVEEFVWLLQGLWENVCRGWEEVYGVFVIDWIRGGDCKWNCMRLLYFVRIIMIRLFRTTFEGIGLDLLYLGLDWSRLMIFEVVIHFLLKLQGQLTVFHLLFHNIINLIFYTITTLPEPIIIHQYIIISTIT